MCLHSLYQPRYDDGGGLVIDDDLTTHNMYAAVKRKGAFVGQNGHFCADQLVRHGSINTAKNHP